MTKYLLGESHPDVMVSLYLPALTQQANLPQLDAETILSLL